MYPVWWETPLPREWKKRAVNLLSSFNHNCSQRKFPNNLLLPLDSCDEDDFQNIHRAKVEWSFNTDETSQDPRWLVGTKHFPESQTLPRIQKPFTESKKHPRIWILRHDLDSLGRVLGVLGSVYGLWELFVILGRVFSLQATGRKA